MKQTFFLISILVGMTVLSVTPAAFARSKPLNDFSSQYYDTSKSCKCTESNLTEGQDCTKYKCSPMEGYDIKISYDGSACDLGKLEISKGKNFSIRSVPEVPEKIEWRFAGNKPFAIIYRLKGPSANCRETTSSPTKPSLVTQGLDGYSNISGEVESKEKDANLKIREVADKAFLNTHSK